MVRGNPRKSDVRYNKAVERKAQVRMTAPRPKPTLLITMGDVAGIGPEIIAGGWRSLVSFSRPIVVGDIGHLEKAVKLVSVGAKVRPVSDLGEADPAAELIPCLAGTNEDLRRVRTRKVSAQAGKAAYDFLCVATDKLLGGEADAMVTAPLHKEGLHAAGLPYPGHTEILAERTHSPHYAMMLYADRLGVVHVTLHMALRDVFQHVTRTAVLEKIGLAHDIMSKLVGGVPRIGVAALNPHASDGGLFGDEERCIIQPAVLEAQKQGVNVAGPFPSDTLFVRARSGEFDAVVAMYHDQGHIAMKLSSGLRAVNITVGLPIVRTSVAHGTAYDIAGRGIADATSLIEAARVAAQLSNASRPVGTAS
jgi:4-hydroxythreonine-4-phosphate dehydrogenase